MHVTRSQIVSSALFMFFTSIAPAVTFAAVLDKQTRVCAPWCAVARPSRACWCSARRALHGGRLSHGSALALSHTYTAHAAHAHLCGCSRKMPFHAAAARGLRCIACCAVVWCARVRWIVHRISGRGSCAARAQVDDRPQLGPVEVILSTAVTGSMFAIFGGQPLVIVGVTVNH